MIHYTGYGPYSQLQGVSYRNSSSPAPILWGDIKGILYSGKCARDFDF